MPELFPHLKSMAGGKKQAWVNSNLDLIVLLNEHIGFEETKRILYMKNGTLVRALRKAEKNHRPAITMAERARLLALSAESKADQALKELAVQAQVLVEQVDEVGELKDNLARYFEIQAQTNTIMAKLVTRTSHASNLTYHIASTNKRKVGPTNRLGSGRLFVIGPRSSRQLPGFMGRHRKPRRRIHNV